MCPSIRKQLSNVMSLIKKIGKVDREMGLRILRAMGIKGGIKSVYHSLRHTNEIDRMLISKGASVRISPEANVSIENVLSIGVYHSDIMHYTTGGPRIHIGPDANFQAKSGIPHIGPGTNMSISGDFSIGNSYINGNSRVWCKDEIQIGDDCSISWDVDILDSNGGHEVSKTDSSSAKAPIYIGDHVWVGHDVSILPGVEIGDGSVISAKSSVNKDVPENSLVAGIPGNIIEENINWS